MRIISYIFLLWVILRSIASNNKWINECWIRKELEGSIHGLTEAHLGATEKTTKNLGQGNGVPAQIRTDRIQNASLECYHYSNSLRIPECRDY
jgi:hypothetical protein